VILTFGQGRDDANRTSPLRRQGSLRESGAKLSHRPLPAQGRRILFVALRLRVRFFCLLLVALATPAYADSIMPDAHMANTQLTDPAKERAAKSLMESVRCLVCQGQSIADSDADMAGDMRALIRQRIDAGESPEQVRTWLVERYGNWVTYDPPFGGDTAALWIAPLIFLGLGALLARGRFKRRKST
jgi:cytochrome c-type biogenesis protein CcmH